MAWNRSLAAAGILILLLLGGCAPVTRAEQVTTTQMTALESRQEIGQSFAANYDGLAAVDLYVDAGDAAGGEGELVLTLWSAPGGAALGSASLPLRGVGGAGFYRFSFPTIRASTQKPFYLSLALSEARAVQLALAPGGAYPDGSLYIDGKPADGQMAFRLAYDPLWMALGLAREAVTWVGALAAAAFLILLPGWALLAGLWPGFAGRWWAEKAALAAGPGLALYPLLFLWSDVVGWKPGALLAWGPPLASLIYLLWRGWKRQEAGRAAGWGLPRLSAPDGVLCAVLFLLCVGRFFAVRELPAPLWGDSLHHAAIAQLMVDQGGLFHSWRPYAAYQTLTVQFGFPAGVAAWAWLTGSDIPRGTLWFGQIVSILAALSLLPLAVKLARGSRWAGVAAVLVAGLLSITPAFYLNWGRYGQLLGQAILPAVMALTWHYLEEGRLQWRLGIALALTIGGMVLGYYRMAVFFLAFLPGLLLWIAFLQRKGGHNWRPFRATLPGLAFSAFLSFVLIAPWLPKMSGSNLAEMVEAGMTWEISRQYIFDDYKGWLDIGEHVPLYLVALTAAALVWTSLLRKVEPLLALVWFALLTAFPLGMLINLPGANMMGGNFTVLIALYLPISLVLGWAVGEAASWLQTRLGDAARVLVPAGLLLAALVGVYQQRGIGNELVYRLVTVPDMAAMEWVRANVPEDARFLVEGFRVHSNTTVVGSDAGWWIPLLAGRINTIPPQYALLNEQPEVPTFTRTLLDNTAYFEQNPVDSPEGEQRLCEWGITHIYVGQQQGLASRERTQLYAPEELAAFSLIYAQDRVRIYQFPRERCSQGAP